MCRACDQQFDESHFAPHTSAAGPARPMANHRCDRVVMTKKLELQGTRMFPGVLSNETSFPMTRESPSHLMLPMPASVATVQFCVGRVTS